MKFCYAILLLSLAPGLLRASDNLNSDTYKKTGAFTPNAGQILDENGKAVNSVLAKSSLPGLDIYLTQQGVSYVFLKYEEDTVASKHPVYITNNRKFKVHYSRVDVALRGATLTAEQLQFSDPETYKSSYYYGATQIEAATSYKMVTVKNAYPGIDWVWKINSKGQPEYDFVVHAGANSSSIKMRYRYADVTAGTNNLLINTHNGAMREGDLKAFAANAQVEASYHYDAVGKEITFNIGSYNTTSDLIIDPPLQLLWNAQYGGSFADGLRGVATDMQGNAYLVGYTTSVNFPFLNPGSSAYCDSTFNGSTDAILLKVSPAQNLLWATFMGGPGNDFANSVSLSSGGQIFMTGGAESGFPLKYYSSDYHDNTAAGQDIFIVRLNSNMSLQWSTFYGGNGTDEALKVYCNNGGILLTGYTHSGSSFPIIYNSGTYTRSPVNSFDNPFLLNFTVYSNSSQISMATGMPDTANAYGTSLSGRFGHYVVAGFSYNTRLNYFGGSPSLLISNGGVDGFLVHFTATGAPEFERFIGGSGNDYITDIAADGSTGFVITGYTNSPNFPVSQNNSMQYFQSHLAGGYDAFVSHFSSDTVLKWSTYYGGTNNDAATGTAVDNQGSILLTGFTFSTDFPVDSPNNGGYYQGVNKGNSDGFITCFTQHGLRTYSTYKGDSCYEYPADIAVTSSGAPFYVCGEGLYACNQSLPDSAFISGGGSGGTGGSSGFCWGFGGAPPSCLAVYADQLVHPCPGSNNGGATVHYSGGQEPYTVYWSSSETSDTATMLANGENFVFVIDSEGCAGDITVNLHDMYFSFSSTGGNCFGDGTGNAYASYGVHPYTYQWANGWPNQGNITGHPGNYPVTITDSKNCSVSGTVVIPLLATPTYSIELLQNPGCGNINGILVAHRNGWQIINADWYNGNNQFLGNYDTLWNIPPGTYYINFANCVDTQQVHPTVTLTDPGIQTNLSVDLEQLSPAGCLYPTGDLYAYPSDYSYPRYLYQWSTGAFGIANHILIDTAHTYSVTVTDSVGCSATASINSIVVDSIHLVNPWYQGPYCYNDHAGAIYPHATDSYSNSWLPLTYYWGGPFVDTATTSYIENLGAGQYGVTVTDDHTGCSAVFSWNLQPYEADHLTIASLPYGCGANTGYAEVTGVTPGAAFINYTWRDSAGHNIANSPAVSNLAPGTYTVQVSTSNPSGNYQACVVIGEEPGVPSVSITSPGQPCNGYMPLQANVSGATSPYTYQWNYGIYQYASTIPNTTAYSSGPYTINVTDYLGCSVSATANFPYHQPFFINSFNFSYDCNDDLVNVWLGGLGGYPPYGGDTGWHTFAPGANMIILHDSHGCTDTANYFVSHHNYLNASYTLTTAPTCNTQGSIAVTATGGTAPYTGTGTFAVSVGNFDHIVTDATGCKDTLHLSLTQSLHLNYTATPLNCISSVSTVTLIPSGGVPPYAGDTGQHQLTAGIYNFSVTDAGGCTQTASVTIAEPDTIQASYTPLSILCYGDSATINVAATGGTQPYGGGIGIHHVPAGNYTYIVTDNGGCRDTVEVTVTQASSAVQLNYTATDAVCYGDSGTVILNATGGTPVYTYPNGQGGLVPAGYHEYWVVDGNGCTDSLQILISQPPQLGFSAQAAGILNCSATAADITIAVTGGTPPYLHSGQFTLTTDSAYNWIVTDSIGCSADSVISIPLPNVQVEISGAPDTACADANIHLSATGSYPLIWNGTVNDSVYDITNIQNTTTVTVSAYDAQYHCNFTDTVTITVDQCLGIQELNTGMDIEAYPNPASNNLHIKVNHAFADDTELKMYAADGKLVLVQSVAAGALKADISCSNLAAGIYLLSVTTSAKNYYYKVAIER